jgi:hypothetical protein
MDVKAVKDLAAKYTMHELLQMADKFELTGEAPVKTQEDAGEQMSDYLQAAELRNLMDQGMNSAEALREFSKRVRGILT